MTAARSCFLAATLAASLAFAGGAAEADDLPIVPQPVAGIGSLPAPLNWLVPNYSATLTPSWTGFFVKPIIGYQSAEFSGNVGRLLGHAQGFTFGGEGGYNYQIGSFVVGPAVDASYSLVQGNANGLFFPYGGKADVGAFGSARARAGYVFGDRFVVYGTGGVAFAETEVNGPFYSESHTEPGWTAGGGIAYLWNPNAIISIEYRRLQTQNANFTGSLPYYQTFTPILAAYPWYQRRVGVAMNLITAGFHFKF